MAERRNEVIDALLYAIRADAEWDHDFTPSPHDPWYVASGLARPENLAELKEAADHPEVGRYAQRALEKLAEAADLDHDDEPKDAVDVLEARAGHHRKVLDDPHAEPSTRRDAAQALAELHRPENANRVLSYLVAERTAPRSLSTIAWLAPHPDSDALLELDAPIDATFEIVRRRRCAGLTTRPDGVREQIIAALRSPMPTDSGPGGQKAREVRRAKEYAARLVVELAIDDDECAEAVARALGPPPALDVSDADVRYLDGFIESDSLAAPSAYDLYAEVLRRDPKHRHAAYQLAWIDRAFGSPITPARVDWLRSLRVARLPFLRELEELVPDVVPGPRLANLRNVGSKSVRFAERAWAAGLPSIAALHYQGYAHRRQRALTKDQAAAQIDRFWR